MSAPDSVQSLQFRDPERAQGLARELRQRVARTGPMAIMHVCGSHEQAMARFGIRSLLPRELEVIMGPGCPVCVTDAAEIDQAVALAEQGVCVATYGDMLRVPGSARSLADVQGEGGRVKVVFSVDQAVELARRLDEPVVFFASGFETTAVATAAALLADPPANFLVLSAHKYVPPAMEAVAAMPERRVAGFLAAGHAATITGYGLFEPFVARHALPVVVAGFEPLDILAALARLVELVGAGRPELLNLYPRCVTREGNRRAQDALWRVFRSETGSWRGIAEIPEGNLRLREGWAHRDAERVLDIAPARAADTPAAALAHLCRCGDIMAGNASPHECTLFGGPCTPSQPVGACMVSSEGTCRIWHRYGVASRIEALEGGP